MDSPNPITVGFSVLGSLRVDKPRPTGAGSEPDHGDLGLVLAEVRQHGAAVLPRLLDPLDDYRATLSKTDPDDLTPAGALAYWLNLYNAGALTLAGEAFATGEQSVLRLPGAFTRPFVTVAGKALSLNHLEHGKIRRFKDPRIHSALVCGSASCPTLRYEPYDGGSLNYQLDDQTRSFLAAGAAAVVEDKLLLSRVFLWYGGDFVRPHRMPTFLPVTKRRVAMALVPWLPESQQELLRSRRLGVGFQPYDWSLACSVRKPV